MKKIALTTLILGLSTSLAPSLAFAQQPQYTGGMKYTTMRPAQPNDSDKKPVYNRKPTSQEAQNTKNDALPNIDEPTAKPAEQSVWDKYKELAAGKTAKDGDESKPQKPKKPETPESIDTSKQAQTKQSTTGIGAIIQDYRRTKEKRGQMKSIRFPKPEVEKPQVAIPSVEKPDAKPEDKSKS